MDLIYTDARHIDQGVLSAYTLDLSFGEDQNENDFELTVGNNDAVLEDGAVIYFEGTEYGGIVDGLKTNSESETRTYIGRTWHGLLNNKVIQPDPGESHLVVSGDANDVLSALIPRFGFATVGEATHGKNLAKSAVVDNVSGAYLKCLYVDIDGLLPDTEYMLSFVGAPGHSFYANEHLFHWAEVVSNGQRQSIKLKTKSDYVKSADTYVDGVGWIIAKNNGDNAVVPAFSDVQFEEGSIATEYEPYRTIYTSTGLFAASDKLSGIVIKKHQFNRYCMGYDGIRTMLADHGAKLKIRWEDGTVILCAERIVDDADAALDNDVAQLIVERHGNKVNHLICLGQGELVDRDVVHLYVDQFGRIGDVQYYTGLQEVAAVYDYNSAQSIDDLRNNGIKHLKELRGNDKVDVSVNDSSEIVYDIGDVITAHDVNSGNSGSAIVTQKIVKIQNGTVSINYKTGR